MNIIFFGSSDYCLPILETLQKKFNLVAVVTKSHNMRTAEQSETPYRPDLFGSGTGVKAFTPKDKTELLALKKDLKELKPDLGFVADYGLIIPKEIFTIPRHQTLNIHFSRLPKYRGPSPVQYTILNGEKSAWITVILMDAGMDTGDILWRKEVGPLDGSESTPDLYRKLFSITAQELPGVIEKFLLKRPKRLKLLKQPSSGVSYTKHFTRHDGFIPFSQLDKSPILIERKIRAFSPWPGVWTLIKVKRQKAKGKSEEKRLKILKAHIDNNKLILDKVQLEGKKPVTWKQLSEGYPDVKNLS